MSLVCALCRVNGDLRDSHIIPEWFFRRVYNPSPRRFRILSTDASIPEQHAQKGLRERLLCGACEQKLGRWERYARGVFVDGHGVTVTPCKDWLELQGVEYKTFKLFLLSLLWRMSVSTLKFFNDVRLGSDDEKLRVALCNDDPLQPSDYPCLLMAVKLEGKFHQDWILEPSPAKWEGDRDIYWLIITGILFIFFVGNQQLPEAESRAVLNERNQMVIPIAEVRNVPFLADVVAKFGTAMQARKQSDKRGA